MKNNLITIYLTSIVMFTLSGLLIIKEKEESKYEIQHLDFSNQPVYIYPKGKK